MAAEQHYFTHDANFNVTAVVDAWAAVVERYDYSPYGQLTVMDADFSNDSDGVSDIGNGYTYTGRYHDQLTGLYHYRNRYYHPGLGRFCSRDPIGYEGSQWNLYEYVEGRPTVELDPSGKQILIPPREGPPPTQFPLIDPAKPRKPSIPWTKFPFWPKDPKIIWPEGVGPIKPPPQEKVPWWKKFKLDVDVQPPPGWNWKEFWEFDPKDCKWTVKGGWEWEF